MDTTYVHPRNAEQTVFGRRLETDEILQDGDVYDSTSGTWEPVPNVGCSIHGGHGATFIRPAKCTAKIPVTHVPSTELITDPDTGAEFVRANCAVCHMWIADVPVLA